ncbi:penicillin acylase family protein [Streptomyces boncukensis]|uniref:Penicillin acylase family protein n=1 Tax=Streptomyces boncukensis TaxID=2711219 RepID=A0A6G4WZB8_9ACTN|nr:penicillin acylase family protein [Streptomyces boncukensis]NGO70212.1 penicillin acylase family protein [Streptomyces boncukensis]
MRQSLYDVPGLAEPVEILVDRWGVPHLYARSRADLFLAQGFNAARDRLFQLDLWRRRGLGLLSEVLGEEYVAHDRAARLFRYRGGMAEEWAAYGPGTEEMARSFTAGINAYVALCRERRPPGADPLPPEFALLGYQPAYWRAEDIARIRSHGLAYNLQDEVARARTLRDFGPGAEDLRRVREPAPHTLRIPEGLDLSVIPDDVLHTYELATVAPWAPHAAPRQGLDGSNNWVLAPSRTATGRPLLANDPHRPVSLPSLRYLAHLTAPGLDVIGAGEPALPGISIGHNGRIAFGLTIFPIDQEDLYVYRTHPDDPHRYAYGDGWEPMERVTETIPVRGRDPVRTELWFTRHGPVVRERPERQAAFAVRAAWLEPGMAPYLGSAGYMDARDVDAFTDALRRWGAPGENQVYAAPDGTVGWRPAGRVPVRPNWDGTLPVPGDGRYEWAGFHDPDALPSVRDPAQGWWATANELNLPADYPHAERTVTYDWYAPTRHARLAEVLGSREDWTAEECVRLQTDCVSLPARAALRLLDGLTGEDPRVRTALALLRGGGTFLPERSRELGGGWDGTLAADSAAGALFEVWYRGHLRPALLREALRPLVPADRLEEAVARLRPAEGAASDARVDPALFRTAAPALLARTLGDAVRELEAALGPDPRQWSWGALHQARLRHPLAAELGEPPWAELAPVPRGGSGDTVGATPYLPDFRQSGGASFRMVLDVGEWDASLVVNSPGQSGDPRSGHYADLLGVWAADGAFPLVYSRERVERECELRIELRPALSGEAPDAGEAGEESAPG